MKHVTDSSWVGFGCIIAALWGAVILFWLGVVLVAWHFIAKRVVIP